MNMEKNELHEYQLFSSQHIITNKFCGLFLDMGLGKTVSTLTAIDYLLYDDLDIKSVLVVAPKRVVESVWEQEINKWAHLSRLKVSKIVGTATERIAATKKKADIYLVSRDNIAWLIDTFNSRNLFFDCLVIDELSSFKSNTSKRFKAIRSIRPLMRRVIGLTGTPSPNSLIDLWAQMYVIDRGERLERTITTYRNMYFVPLATNGHIVYSYGLRPGAESIIHSKIGDICISMKAIDHIKMPERIDNIIRVPMTSEVKEMYVDFEKTCVLELINEIGDTTEIPVVNAAALSNKLLQFSNGAVYDKNRNVHNVHNLKIDALKELIEDANGQPILIAWSYRHDLYRLREALEKYKPRELLKDSDVQDWNNGKIQILLVHPASVGHGLNLQGSGNIIVWFGLTWSLELYMQLNARLFRQGQKHSSVVINHLILEKSHDEDVIKSLNNKNKTQESLMKSVRAKIDRYTSEFS